MWLYVFCATVFLYVTNAVLETHYNEEAMFADVIRNISRVNNVLQELISNYEQLQKIYKSQENSEDYSSDTEIDEVFKSMKNVKYNAKLDANAKMKSKLNPTDRPINADSFPATQMIWSEDDADDDYEEFVDDKSKEKDHSDVEKRLPKTESLQKAKSTITDDTIENTSSESMEIIKDISFKKILKPKQAEIVFIDTHKKIEAITENKKVSSKKISEPTKKPKTRYKSGNYKREDKTNKALKQNSDTQSIKKVIYAEKFSPKSIWKEIIKNKPIQLEEQKEITYNTPQKRDDIKPTASLRSEAGKTALVIVSKSNTKDVKAEKNTFESSEDQALAKEIFKTNVLRKAYGDACSIVVIKKCYKACKHAGQSYCALYKCKQPFRSKFKELSKTGCLREFVGLKDNKSDIQYRRQDDVFVDAARGRFFEAACFPHMESNHKPITLRNNTPSFKAGPITNHDKTINILRDKYERACKKVSSQKCTSACNYAYTNTCNSFKCENKKLKRFKKYCKQQCNIAYKVYSDSESSSDSNSGSSDTNTS